MKIVQINSLYKVLPCRNPDMLEFSSFSALKNEVFNYQIVISNCENEAYTASFRVDSPLSGKITVRRVGYIYANMPSYTDENMRDSDYITYDPGMLPDPLYPVSGGKVELRPNENTVLYITVALKNQAPGVYPINVFITINGEETVKTFYLEVIDAELPKQELMYTNWFHCDSIADYHGVEVFSEKHWALIEKYIKTAVAGGMNMILTPIFTPPLDTEVGGERRTVQLVDVKKNGKKYTFEFSKLVRWINLCKKCGIKYFEMSHLFTQWGAKATPKIVAEEDGKLTKIFGWDVPSDDKRYKDFLSKFLPELIKVLKKNRVADKTFFHISDEPNKDAIDTYLNCKKIVEDQLRGFPIMDALSNVEFYKNGAVENPVPGSNHIDDFLSEDIKERWTYYCCSQYKDVSNRFVAMPAYRTRIIGTQFFKYDIKGFLQWGYNYYYCRLSRYIVSPYEKSDAELFPTGDAYIVYPYKNGVIESLRARLFFDAIQDLGALKLLAGRIGKEETVKLMESVAGEEITFSKYPKDPEYILRLRGKVNELLSQTV